jgi:hypothetical protein
MKTFRLYCVAMAINARCDMYLEPCRARRPRHRQAVREEIPVLGYEIDDNRLAPSPTDAKLLGLGAVLGWLSPFQRWGLRVFYEILLGEERIAPRSLRSCSVRRTSPPTRNAAVNAVTAPII